MATAPEHSHIQGWGADLDPNRRPAVPMERTPPRLDNVHWDEPEPQPQRIEVLQSIEYPERTPVFGTSAPPSGASGWLRRRAFRRSENDILHWMMLLFADRVNAAEGLVQDLGRPDHRKQLAVVSVATVSVAALATLWLLGRKH
jgi:hypothetical protein